MFSYLICLDVFRCPQICVDYSGLLGVSQRGYRVKCLW